MRLPVLLDGLKLDDVLAAYARLYEQGRHGLRPSSSSFEWARERKGGWVLASVPLDMLNYQGVDESNEARVARAWSYAMLRSPLPPGVALYAGRERSRRSRKAYVVDGNHRALAAELRGERVFSVFMERGEFEALVADVERQGVG